MHLPSILQDSQIRLPENGLPRQPTCLLKTVDVEEFCSHCAAPLNAIVSSWGQLAVQLTHGTLPRAPTGQGPASRSNIEAQKRTPLLRQHMQSYSVTGEVINKTPFRYANSPLAEHTQRCSKMVPDIEFTPQTSGGNDHDSALVPSYAVQQPHWSAIAWVLIYEIARIPTKSNLLPPLPATSDSAQC